MTVNVFLTVDTEHSIGGAFADPKLQPVGNDKRIFGRVGGREYGIPLIMDIAERFGLPLTFYVEVFNRYFFGKDETRQVVKYILDRGHDTQLHLHPNYLNFTLNRPQDLKFSDLIGEYSLERQIEMIGEARQMLIDCGAKVPVAFRAGCFGASEDTLKALKENDFLVDSSYNQSYLGSPCLMPDWRLNDLALKNDIFELPITNFIEKSGLRSSRCMPLDINGVSFEEMRHVLTSARDGSGQKNITIILHSFSFIKPLDVQYSQARIRQHVINRFEKLCRFLSDNNKDFKVRTPGELSKKELEDSVLNRSDVMIRVPGHLSLLRFFGQLKDNLL